VCGYADYKQFQFDLVDKFVERGECLLMFCCKYVVGFAKQFSDRRGSY